MDASGAFNMDDYKKIQCIGQGGFGTVYLCQHQKFKRCVLKEVYIAEATGEEIYSLSSEAGMLSSLNHPHVIRYLCHGTIQNNLYLVMEYAPLGDLDKFISTMEDRSETAVKELFAQVVCAVEYIHDKDIVHRDICARNVLVCSGKLLKISDFGLSRKIESISSGGAKGNPNNYSPEMCWGGKASKASDMWALGCLLYHLSWGRQAFGATSLAGTVKLIVSGPTPELPMEFSLQLKQLLQDLFSRAPAARPTARQLLSHPELALIIHERLPRMAFDAWSPKGSLAALGFGHLL